MIVYIRVNGCFPIQRFDFFFNNIILLEETKNYYGLIGLNIEYSFFGNGGILLSLIFENFKRRWQ